MDVIEGNLSLTILDHNLGLINRSNLVTEAFTDTKGLYIDGIINPFSIDEFCVTRSRSLYNFEIDEDFGSAHFSSESLEYFLIVCERLKALNLHYWVNEICFKATSYKEIEKLAYIFPEETPDLQLFSSTLLNTNDPFFYDSVVFSFNLTIYDLNKKYINEFVLSEALNTCNIGYSLNDSYQIIKMNNFAYIEFREEAFEMIKYFIDDLLDKFALVTPEPHILYNNV